MSQDLVIWISEGRSRWQVAADRVRAWLPAWPGRIAPAIRAPELIVVDRRIHELNRWGRMAACTALVLSGLITAGHAWSPHPGAQARPTAPGAHPLAEAPQRSESGRAISEALFQVVASGQRTQERLLARLGDARARISELETAWARALAAARDAERRLLVHQVSEASRGRVDPEQVVTALYSQIERLAVPDSYARELAALVPAIIKVESAWRPDVVSDAGAMGLMQVLPTWHTLPGLRREDCPGALTDIETNICAGLSVWLYYLRLCDGAEACALAYYNGASTYSESANQYIGKVVAAYD